MLTYDLQRNLTYGTDLEKQAIERMFTHDTKYFNKSDFMLYLSDIFSYTALADTHSGISDLCAVLESPEPVPELLNAGTKYNVSYLNYDAKWLNEVSGANASPVKAWRWQQCTELGWFKTANDFYPLTSSTLNEEWWLDYCKRIFGDQIKRLDTSIAAFRYGQRDVVAKNVVFVSETLDPFRALGHHAVPRAPSTMNVFFDCPQ